VSETKRGALAWLGLAPCIRCGVPASLHPTLDDCLRFMVDRVAHLEALVDAIPASRRCRKFDHDEARRLLDGGMSVREVAARLVVSASAIHRARHASTEGDA